MSLADYLAKNYLKADAKPDKERKKGKKRKRKDGSGLVIADDDTQGWENDGKGDDDEDGPMMVSSTSAEFRKAKTNNWKSLSGAPASVPDGNGAGAGDAAAADAIIASAAAENAARAAADEDAPMVMDEDGEQGVEKLESGAHAGLQSGAQLAAQLAAQAKAERARMEQEGAASMGHGAETIYRDASGRIVNVAMKRAEARAKEEAAAARKAQEAEEAKGDVQRQQRDARRAALDDAKYMTVARGADDIALNEELKAQQRWNDPAAQFMATAANHHSATGHPLYKGHATPNRYNIRPGAKWDGVDRGNGFEADWFKARNRKSRLQALDYAWQTDE